MAIEQIRTDAQAVLALLRRPETDLATPVPSCPGWTLEELGDHLGRVYAMVAAVIELGASGTSRPAGDQRVQRLPGTPVSQWLSERLEAMLQLFEETPLHHRCWNFVSGPASETAFWWRRQAHETLIHRADAELAVGELSYPAPAVAADGISEFFELGGFELVGWAELPLGEAMTVHLHALDAGEGAEWTVDTESRAFAMAHLKADVALRGPAWAIDRWLWRRGSLAGEGASDLSGALEAFGDWRAAERWRPAY